jgi:type VI secretion system protein VasD
MAMNSRFTRALRWAAVALVLGVSACSFGPRKDVGIRAEAQSSLNRDDQGRPLSVVLRIYQLRDAGEFSRAPFEQLARRDREVLGADLIDRREVVMIPDATFSDVQKLADNTRFVGVMAMFRRPDTRMWRYVFDRKDFDRGGIAFRLEDCAIRVMAGKPLAVEGDPQALTPVCRDETPARQAPAVRPAQPIRR